MAEPAGKKGKKEPRGKPAAPPGPAAPAVPPRLRERYRQEIVPALMKQFGYGNRLQAPRLEKVVLNMGLGEGVGNTKVIDAAVEELAAITGQRPVVTRAKRAEAGFKLRAGMAIGAKVTLRGDRMYEFLDRLLSAALPRIRDFRGLSASGFDHSGNYSFGIREQTIFPELHLDDVHYTLGMDITIVTTAKVSAEARALLQAFGLPFEK